MARSHMASASGFRCFEYSSKAFFLSSGYFWSISSKTITWRSSKYLRIKSIFSSDKLLYFWLYTWSPEWYVLPPENLILVHNVLVQFDYCLLIFLQYFKSILSVQVLRNASNDVWFEFDLNWHLKIDLVWFEQIFLRFDNIWFWRKNSEFDFKLCNVFQKDAFFIFQASN